MLAHGIWNEGNRFTAGQFEKLQTPVTIACGGQSSTLRNQSAIKNARARERALTQSGCRLKMVNAEKPMALNQGRLQKSVSTLPTRSCAVDQGNAGCVG